MEYKESVEALKLFFGDEYDLDRLKELVEADKEGRCLTFPAGCEFENGIYVLCGDISKVKEDKKRLFDKVGKSIFPDKK